MHVAFHPNKKHQQMFRFAHKGRRSDLHHMHIALHSNKKHRWMFAVHTEVVRIGVTCMLHCTSARRLCKMHTENRGGVTCKLFRKVVGVSQDVLPIKISRPSLALSLWATLISLRVNPPTTKATMRFPCNMRVCHPY